MARPVSALFPAALHRGVLRFAHRVRLAWWRRTGAVVRGCQVIAVQHAPGDAGLPCVLLVRHSYHASHKWMLPGGGLASGEDPVAAAVRELAEETGCRLANAAHFAQVDLPRGGWTNRIELVWGTTADSPRADGREILDAAFFPLDALPEAITDWSAAHLERWKSGERWQDWRPQSER